MNSKSYAAKPWWPREPKPPSPHPDPADRVALFRQRVARAARRAGAPLKLQLHALAALDELPVSRIRPDLGRQAQEWLAQHRRLPRPDRGRPHPATLVREALARHGREEQHQPFRAIATRLGITTERARQIYARALTRARRFAPTGAPAAAPTLFT